jgi:hypothetical protein
MNFEEVLAELQIDEDELKRMVAQGELRGFRDGETMKFRRADVSKIKKGRETEPTIILTDSDADISLPESKEDHDLLVEEPSKDAEDRDTVVNIDVFETTDVKVEDSDIPTVDVESIEGGGDTVQFEDDTLDLDMSVMDDDEGAATLIDVGGPTEMATESFDLIEEAPPADDFEVVDTTITGSGRISRSARLRAMQIKKKKGHPVMTAFIFVTSLIMLFGFTVLFNTIRGVEPKYIVDIGRTCRDIIDWITSIFA